MILYGDPVPSAGALYPLELFVIAKNVKGLENGKYHYLPPDHALDLIEHGCFSENLASACLHQGSSMMLRFR